MLKKTIMAKLICEEVDPTDAVKAKLAKAKKEEKEEMHHDSEARLDASN